MIRMFVRHTVQDYGAWRKAYDGFDGERRTMGVTGHAVFQAADNPNDVTAWHDFPSLESARAFVGSDRLKEVMRGAGVVGMPTIWFVKGA